MIEQNINRTLSEEERDRELWERISGLPAEKRAALLKWLKEEFPDS